jgi:hypothetical protein
MTKIKPTAAAATTVAAPASGSKLMTLTGKEGAVKKIRESLKRGLAGHGPGASPLAFVMWAVVVSVLIVLIAVALPHVAAIAPETAPLLAP